MIIILTYNSFFNFIKRVIIKIAGRKVLVLPCTFNPKCPENVLPTDSSWMYIIENKDYIERIFIFAGKKSSGTLEIIELACKEFANNKEKLFFVLCDHDLEEKELLLKKHDIKRTQYVVFEDGHLPCQESEMLYGYAYGYIQRHKLGSPKFWAYIKKIWLRVWK